MCVHIADSLCCITETNTALKSNYTPIKKKREQLDQNLYSEVQCYIGDSRV